MSTAGSALSRQEDRILVRGARQVVTLQGPARMRRGEELNEVGVLRDASILVEGTRIVQVGNARRIDNLRAAENARVIDARRTVILPAVCDAVGDLLPLEAADADEGGEDARGYEETALNTAARRLTRELRRLARLGTVFAQFQLRLPDSAVLQSRLLRNLLHLDVTRGSFRAALRVVELPSDAVAPGGTPVTITGCLPPSARTSWQSLEPMLAVILSARTLLPLSPVARVQLLRGFAEGLPCFVDEPELLSPQDLLQIGYAAAHPIQGDLPGDEMLRRALAGRAVPWIVPGSRFVRDGSAIETLPAALQAGMLVALCTGFQLQEPGVADMASLWVRCRQRAGVSVEALLQLTIANTAHAMGAGARMGSIEVGKDANLLLFECDDYRDLGVHFGLPHLVGVMRRGRLLWPYSPPE